jgi:hypothetical protein
LTFVFGAPLQHVEGGVGLDSIDVHQGALGLFNIAALISYLMRRDCQRGGLVHAHFLVSVPREVKYQRRQLCKVKGT